MRLKLTDALIDRRKAPETGREEIFDTLVPGFGIRIGQRDRAFFFIRRIRGEKVRFSLGQYPAVSLHKARTEALEIVDKIKRGLDPRLEARRRKDAAVEDAANTFGRVAERFLNEYVRGKKKPLRATTVRGYEWALIGDPTSKWRNRPLASLEDRDLIQAIDVYEAEKKFASARLLRAYLHRFFRWSVEKRLIERNPASNIPLASAPSDFKRERVLSTAELRRVLRAADQLSEVQGAFVKMLVLTGQRRGETSLMKWSDLSLDGSKPVWSIPAENAKNGIMHDVPLSVEAVTLLSPLSRLGEYVFTTDGRTPMSGFSKLKAKIDILLIANGKTDHSAGDQMALDMARFETFSGYRNGGHGHCSAHC